MHPLKQYLQEVGESVQDFANRVGASRQTLYRIISGVQAPKPMLARRIAEATGGSVTLGMLYGDTPGGGAVIALPSRRDDIELDCDRLKLAIAVVVNHLRPHEASLAGPQTLTVAAEAAASTYVALSRLTTRRGPARLAQALRPVLEEIVKESGSLPATAALERGADLAAELYFQTGASVR
ncbi:MAG: helix-turn-helix transcriptional regulator [Pseudomonadota bacterium]